MKNMNSTLKELDCLEQYYINSYNEDVSYITQEMKDKLDDKSLETILNLTNTLRSDTLELKDFNLRLISLVKDYHRELDKVMTESKSNKNRSIFSPLGIAVIFAVFVLSLSLFVLLYTFNHEAVTLFVKFILDFTDKIASFRIKG